MPSDINKCIDAFHFKAVKAALVREIRDAETWQYVEEVHEALSRVRQFERDLTAENEHLYGSGAGRRSFNLCAKEKIETG